jgi:hypothetical protein
MSPKEQSCDADTEKNAERKQHALISVSARSALSHFIQHPCEQVGSKGTWDDLSHNVT